MTDQAYKTLTKREVAAVFLLVNVQHCGFRILLLDDIVFDNLVGDAKKFFLNSINHNKIVATPGNIHPHVRSSSNVPGAIATAIEDLRLECQERGRRFAAAKRKIN
jgi:hypothetical protein